ncbi:hypothetical protein, partial [Sodalis sp.]|uniref:hypothetical protein n=1 Tax=Sodalis sp. (in: enterobacteria) TaxID=1898979 RepID=UPI003873CA84
QSGLSSLKVIYYSAQLFSIPAADENLYGPSCVALAGDNRLCLLIMSMTNRLVTPCAPGKRAPNRSAWC